MPRRKAPSVIEVANERVPIVKVCQMLGLDLPDGYADGRPVKVRCPSGRVYHRDEGVEAAMRVYVDSNHTWCFACSFYGTPVSLLAQAWDTDPHSAAIALLERIGHKPISLAQAWAQACQSEVVPDRTLLAEALKTYCARIAPQWPMAQFDTVVAGMLTRCLGLLDRVRSDDEATQWLAGCKQAMATVLHPPAPL